MSDPIAQLFDRIADGYDEEVPFYASIGRLLVQWAEPAADARVLDAAAELERIGLRPVDHSHAEVDLPIDGPDAYWQWLLMHGNRWLYELFSESDREEFRLRVLDSLVNHHPAHGKRLIAGAVFERLERI
jgi:hypothetical protein